MIRLVPLATAFTLLVAASNPAVAGWEAVEGEALKALVSDTTWEGKGFTVYWYANGQRKVVTATDNQTESWEITDEGKTLCAGKDGPNGERCGVIEVKKNEKKPEKTKWRSTRTKPSTGKRFHFKVVDGINE